MSSGRATWRGSRALRLLVAQSVNTHVAYPLRVLGIFVPIDAELSANEFVDTFCNVSSFCGGNKDGEIIDELTRSG